MIVVFNTCTNDISHSWHVLSRSSRSVTTKHLFLFLHFHSHGGWSVPSISTQSLNLAHVLLVIAVNCRD